MSSLREMMHRLREWWTNRCSICGKQIIDDYDNRDGSHLCWGHEGEFCQECEEEYFTCPICNCQFSSQYAADVCRDWDQIFGKESHQHTQQHDHEGKEQ